MLLLAVACLGGQIGCAHDRAAVVFAFEADRYPATFDATRAAVESFRFTVDRSDARAGVMTTRPKSTGGLATPWDPEQSTLAQEWADAINMHERVVRVTFAPGDPAEPRLGVDQAPFDLRTHAGTVTGRVEVFLYRRHRSGWRIETESIARSSRTVDPGERERGVGGLVSVPIGQDVELAERIAHAIQSRLETDG